MGMNLQAKKDGYYHRFKNKNGEDVDNDIDSSAGTLDSVLIDCEKLNCKNKFRVFVEKDEKYNDKYDYEDRQIEVKTLSNGKKYGKIPLKKGDKSSWGNFYQEESARFLFPKSSGYSNDFYNDRDLNTHTKQIKFDLDKEFNLGSTQHSLKYGGFYEKTLKNMVNNEGYTAANVQWWADYFFCNKAVDGTFPIERNPAPGYSAHRCALMNYENYKYTYLIPVTTKNNVLYFGDNVQLTSWLGLDLNYRYDHVKYLPSYDKNIPVPGGLIAGIFVPFDEKDVVYGTSIPTGYKDCRYNTDCYKNNMQKNLALLLRKTTYKHHSYNLALNLDPTNCFVYSLNMLMLSVRQPLMKFI